MLRQTDDHIGSPALELNYERFLKFMINLGFLASERQAYHACEERSLVYDLWRCLARVHADSDRVIVSNLRTMLHAVVGLPLWVITTSTAAQSFSNLAEFEAKIPSAAVAALGAGNPD